MKKVLFFSYSFVFSIVFSQEINKQEFTSQEFSLIINDENIQMPTLSDLQTDVFEIKTLNEGSFEVNISNQELKNYLYKKEFAQALRNRNTQVNRTKINPLTVLNNGAVSCR